MNAQPASPAPLNDSLNDGLNAGLDTGLNTRMAASTCPLCGQANQCAITAGLPAESCWCMQEPVSREALAQLPAEARGKACICPACGSGQFPGAEPAKGVLDKLDTQGQGSATAMPSDPDRPPQRPRD